MHDEQDVTVTTWVHDSAPPMAPSKMNDGRRQYRAEATEAGRVVSHAQVKKRLSKWLGGSRTQA
jgi:hypothetical protein